MDSPQQTSFVFLCQFVRPNARDAPSESLKRLFYFAVTLFVAENFRVPVFQVGERTTITAWAGVPETPINEYDKSFCAKNKVGLAEKFLIPSPAGDFVLAE